MNFVKKYWWAFLILALVVAYFLYKNMQAKNAAPKKPSCTPISADDWESRVAITETNIRANQGWMDKLDEATQSGWGTYGGMDIDAAVRKSAELEVQSYGYCAPATA